PSRNFTPLGEPLSVVFERLQASGLLYPMEGRIPDPLPRSFDPSKTCAYHSGVKGHSTDHCYALKHKVEDLIEMKQITVKQPTPNVNNNPLPNHNGASVNMIGVYEGDDDPTKFIVPVESIENYIFVVVTYPAITIGGFAPIEILGAPSQSFVYDTKVVPWNYKQAVMECRGKETVPDKTKTSRITRFGRCYMLEELAKLRQNKESNVPPKRVVTEAEVEDFLRKFKASEYSVVDHLKKTNAQIPILSLLLTSEVHRNALLQILSGAYVPSETTSEALAGMMERVIDSHRISFDNEELPPEGCAHNKALHITVKYRNMFVSEVLIDGDSGLNICPLSTLKKLGYNTEEVKEAREKKGKRVFLPKPIPTIDQSFSKLVISKTPDMFAEITYDDIVDGIKTLFLEDEGDHDVAIKDIAETPTVRIVEHESDKKNWSCISAPIRWEFQ
ncbi:hypothetical protein MTR67_043068, partial [Solanum verrucosum]